VGEVICKKESKKMLDYNEYKELKSVIGLIPILNDKGVEVSVSFTTKGNITVVLVDNKQFAWDSDTASQEIKDRFYKKVEELLENE
jgi:hypothetical protein